MQFLRKLGLGLALFLYAPLLLILPTVLSLNATLNKPSFVKETLVQAKIYPALNNYIIEQASKSTELSSNPIALQALKETFTGEALQEVFEPTVDSIYKWLDNPEEKFDISISTKPLIDKFKARLDQSLASQLTTLPKCSGRTQPTSTDPFKLNCIPPNLTIEQIRQQAQAQINGNSEIAEQENISLTENNEQLPQDEAAASAGPEQSQTQAPQLNVEQFKMLAKLYQITKASTPYLIGLLVLSSIAILLLSTPWIRGLKRIGVFLLVNGGLLLISSAGSAFLLRTLLPVPATEGTIGAAGREVANLMTQDIIAMTRNFAIGYLVVGVIALVVSIVLNKKMGGAKPKSSDIEQQDLAPKESKPELPKEN